MINQPLTKIAILAVLLFFSNTQNIIAQEVWSLEKCIEYAYSNNLRLQQTDLTIKGFELAEKQARADRLPSLNGTVRYNVNFSNAIDPTTFERLETQQAIQSNSFDLTTQIPLYQGGRLSKLIEKSQLDLQKTLIDKETAKNDISIAIARAYLGVLMAKEQLTITNSQKDLSVAEKDNTQKLINAGLLPEGDILDAESRIINNELSITSAQNVYDLALLDLKQLLDIDPNTDMILELPPDIEPASDLIFSYDIDEIYNAALKNQPTIKSARLNNEISLKSLEIAKTRRYPSLSFIGNLSTNFSTARKDAESFELNNYRPIGIAGPDTLGLPNPNNVVYEPRFIPVSLKTINYFDQLDQNFLPFLALNLQVPIFNQFQVNNNIERAQLDFESSRLNQRIMEQNLNKAIRLAYFDALAASKTYQATQKSIEANKISYEYTKKRYSVGLATSLELGAALGTLAVNEIEATRNKYDYLFKLKILDFYLGKPIKF